jgi:hypothetical protein
MKILKGVPIPSKLELRNGKAELLFVNEMQIGDCIEFLLSDDLWKKKSDTIRRKMRRNGFVVRQQKQHDKLLVWRVS